MISPRSRGIYPILLAAAGMAACSPLLVAQQQQDRQSEQELRASEMAGAILFRDKGCAQCHGEGGVGTGKAPSLVDIAKSKTWTAERITKQILNGGPKMPPFSESLTDPEIAQIVAYLRAGHRPVPPPAAANPQ